MFFEFSDAKVVTVLVAAKKEILLFTLLLRQRATFATKQRNCLK